MRNFNERYDQAVKEMQMDEIFGFGNGKAIQTVKDFLMGDSAKRYVDVFANHQFGGNRLKAIEKLAPIVLQHAKNKVDPVILQDRLANLIRSFLKDPNFGREADTSHVEPAMGSGSREPRDTISHGNLRPVNAPIAHPAR